MTNKHGVGNRESERRKRASAVLDELEAYLNESRYALFSNSRITVDRVKMETYLRELREYLREE